MYERTFWIDHVEDQEGTVFQEGTLLDQAHFNPMEVGIEDANLAHKLLLTFVRWIERRLTASETTSAAQATEITNIKAKDSTQDASLTAQATRITTLESETTAEVKEVTLTANSNPWPFCNDDKNVVLTTVRKNTNYTVDVYVKSVTGGRLGDITVSGKGTNSFKVRHDGSAKTVVLALKITGGMK